MTFTKVFRSRRKKVLVAVSALAAGSFSVSAMAQDSAYSADQYNAGWSDDENARAFKEKLNRYADRGDWKNAYQRSIAKLDVRLDQCAEMRTELSTTLEQASQDVSAGTVRDYRNCVATTGVQLTAFDEALTERETALLDGAGEDSASTRWPQVAELRATYSDVRTDYEIEEEKQRELIAGYNRQEKLATR